MTGEAILAGLGGLVALAAWGRLALSLLPPGAPGSHRPARLLETWAASHLLGLIVLFAIGSLASACDLRLSPVLLWTLLAALALVRAAFLPGSMVPHHARPRARRGPLPAFLLAALIVLTVVPIGATTAGLELSHLEALDAWSATAPWQADPFRFLSPASHVALVVILLHGLEGAGLSPSVRRTAVLLLLVTPAFWTAGSVWSDGAQTAMLFGSGCAFMTCWLRRADRRAGALAALAFGACPAYERAALPLGIAGLIALVVHTHENARRPIALGALGALLLGAPTFAAWSVHLDRARPAASAEAVLRTLLADAGHWATAGPFWYAVAAGLVLFGARAVLPGAPEAARRQRATRALATTLVLALLGAVLVGSWAERLDLGTFVGSRFLAEAAPAGLLLVALVFGRSSEAPS